MADGAHECSAETLRHNARREAAVVVDVGGEAVEPHNRGEFARSDAVDDRSRHNRGTVDHNDRPVADGAPVEVAGDGAPGPWWCVRCNLAVQNLRMLTAERSNWREKS